MIECSDVVKRFGAFLALDRVSFHVGRERVAAFLGLNGAGKTTTLRILSCYMPPTAGRVSIGGMDTVRESDAVRQRLGYLPERVPLYDEMRVEEYLAFRARLKGLRGKAVGPALARVLSRCGLSKRSKSPIGTLSKGYRQRVGIADALIHDPPLLLLDEPTSGLDPDQRIEVRSLIRDEASQRTVLLSTHILPEAEAVCDDVVIIHGGRIRASGSLAGFREEASARTRIRHGGPPLAGSGGEIRSDPEGTTFYVESGAAAARAVGDLVAAGRPVYEVVPEAPSLEQTFIRLTTGREEGS